ncbi:hypothetical protein IGI04_018943 [Brassica rapa subsp. trilocularis]|uniref:Uncharacterized protein n=1 Tax=Brassica rapa subsp. trilocularis TaxID=1813537 RepID=A0ABQ7MEE8_BRACM|nr:hypothetical protein IGI04_018943 [Brassica rapa subsp. trilocularis]
MASSSILLADLKVDLCLNTESPDEKVYVQQIILKPALENDCGILRMICTLDSKRTRLSL